MVIPQTPPVGVSYSINFYSVKIYTATYSLAVRRRVLVLFVKKYVIRTFIFCCLCWFLKILSNVKFGRNNKSANRYGERYRRVHTRFVAGKRYSNLRCLGWDQLRYSWYSSNLLPSGLEYDRRDLLSFNRDTWHLKFLVFYPQIN